MCGCGFVRGAHAVKVILLGRSLRRVRLGYRSSFVGAGVPRRGGRGMLPGGRCYRRRCVQRRKLGRNGCDLGRILGEKGRRLAGNWFVLGVVFKDALMMDSKLMTEFGLDQVFIALLLYFNCNRCYLVGYLLLTLKNGLQFMEINLM